MRQFNAADPQFAAAFQAFLDERRGSPADVDAAVAGILAEVKAEGLDAVLRLAERGDLDLDGPAERYLTPWPLAKSPFPTSAVTIRRLLNHTAGLNAGADTFRNPDQPARTI